jgi:hypothetical protein
MRPFATCAARAISVEGGQINTSAAGGAALTPAAIDSISSNCAEVPCIFQFPAIKRRMSVHLGGSVKSGSKLNADRTLRDARDAVCSLAYARRDRLKENV